jgi:hypothetical protein
VKTSINLDNSYSEKTLINWTLIANSKKPALKMIQLITVSIPEDSNEREYRRVLLKTMVDLCRLSSVQSTFFAKAFMENFSESANWEFRCPFKAVNRTVSNF